MNTSLRRLSVLCVIGLLGASAVFGSEPQRKAPGTTPAASDDHAAMSDLMSVIDDVSSLATKSKMNADFVPGILSVLHGDELSALGVHTVWEALELVPGLNVDRDNNGGTVLVSIRGLRHGNGNVKLLLNSIAMNNAFSGYSNILSVPIEQVERIEVIRGPGSAVHGEFAFAGVINVVTRRNENRMQVRVGSGNTNTVGGVATLYDVKTDWRLNLNVAGWNSDGSETNSGKDYLYLVGLGALSEAPRSVQSAEKERMLILSAEHKDFALTAQFSRTRNGPFFGALNVLPPETNGKYAALAEQLLVQARQGFRLSDTLSGEFKLSWSQFTGDWDEQVLPPGVTYPLFSGTVYPDGVFLENYIRVRRHEAELDLNWTGWTGHNWQLYLASASTEIEDAWWRFNGNLANGQPTSTMERYDGDQNYIDEGAKRDSQSFAIQDQFRLLDQLEITTGVRYDNYSDAGDNLSPRLAAVWSLNDHHILKAQYAQAFFPPTFFQRYGVMNTLLPGEFAADPETIVTSELGYIYRGGTSVARATLFHSSLNDLIVIENNRYVNHGRASLQGLETELEQRLNSDWKVVANLSYSEARDEELGGPLAGSSDWLGNLSLLYRPTPDLLLTGHWRYVGHRHRAVNDTRQDSLPGYSDVSVTLNWFNVATPGLTLRTGVKNLLAESIKSPALANGYVDDYPLLDERTWWVQLSYELR